MIGFERVAPGLYARIDTPRHVRISDKLINAIRREGCSLLNEILDRAIAEDAAREAGAGGER